MTFKKTITIIAVLILSLTCLIGCSIALYNVAFDTNGGNEISSKLTSGYVARPTDPTKDGYNFDGWYTDKDCTNSFDFKTMISENITLYAKWIPVNQNDDDNQTDTDNNDNNQNDNNTQTNVEYTVTFEVNGGSSIPSAKTSSRVVKPADPSKNNSRFDGWFTDANLTHEFDFNTVVTANITLYAKWTHIENTSYNEGTYNNDPVDPYILAMTIDDYSISSSDDYALLLDYAVLNQIKLMESELKISIAGDSAFDQFIHESMAKMKIHTTCHFDFAILGSILTTEFTYPEMATTSASDIDAYVQLPFVCNHLASTRSEDFNNFKINNVTNTYTVTNSDQLCYVLEHGYKPLFSSETCQAKKMYDKACEVLISICDDTFTDIEKLHAIYDWIIENVTYDDVLYRQVARDEEDLKKYKGFYLEGVFDDHRAVCDGISKAFMVMARIEGIECVQVSGTSVISGVGHAWNKVRLDNRWYIVDATGGGVIVGNEEMLSHNLFMCNEAYYNEKYEASNYTEFVADSEYSIYRDLKYTYNDNTHYYYIDDIDELADILAYYSSLNNNKTINFYYAGDEDLSSAIRSAMQKAHLSGRYITVNDGSIIFRFTN